MSKILPQNVFTKIDIAWVMWDPVIHTIQWCTAFIRVAFISSCKFTSSFSFCQPYILFREGMIALEMHNFNNYSTASQHFHVLHAQFFNSFDNNAYDSKGRSHQITACRHNGLSRLIVWFETVSWEPADTFQMFIWQQKKKYNDTEFQ